MIFRLIDIPETPAHELPEQAAPMLQWVALSDLVLDGRYQREITPQGRRNIARIAQEFRWSRFSPLLVAPIEGGTFAVIDGQHRAHAAALCGIARVPVMAVLMDLAEQAQAFRAVNAAVTKVSGLQLFKAALAAGADWAVECDRVVADAGCTLRTSNVSSLQRRPGQITCIGLVRRHVDGGTGNVITAALRGVVGSSEADCVELYQRGILGPFCAAIAGSTRYLRADLAAFLDRHDLLSLSEEARARAKTMPGGGNARHLLQDMIAPRLHAFTLAEVA